MKKTAKRLLALAMLASVTAAFGGFGLTPWGQAVRLQVGPFLVNYPVTALVVVFALSYLFGRFFCETMCPLGICQSIVHKIFHPRSSVRRVCTRLPETKAQRLVRWSIFAVFVILIACGYGGLAYLVEPYALYGKALTLFVPGVILFALVLILAAIGKGRLWCNWICPFGTFMNLPGRLAWVRHEIGEGCGECRACWAAAKTDAAPSNAEASGLTRRETLKGLAVLAVSEKLVDGGFASVTEPQAPTRVRPVLPPGAVAAHLFARTCVGCGLCAANCPEKIIKMSTNWKRFGQVELDFRTAYCVMGCNGRCGTVCPTGAIRPLARFVPRKDIHMGLAVWQREKCLRSTAQETCTACARKCPVKAIHFTEGFPVVDERACIGCGACEHVCPARPEPAIVVHGYAEPRIVTPRAPESDRELREVMRAEIAAGASIVVARGGVIVARATGKGLEPIFKMLDEGALKGSLVMDRVIGRAAAAVAIVGGAEIVAANVMSREAIELLTLHGVAAEPETAPVSEILNQTRTGKCPLEMRVETMTDPEEMVRTLRATIKGMNGN